MRRNASNQNRPPGFGGGSESSAIEPCQNERIDRVSNPRRSAHLWKLGPFRGNERPVLLPLGSLRHPIANQADLPIAQGNAGINRRHARRLVLGRDAPDELALLGIAGDYPEMAA